MNIEQIRQDKNNGVTICRSTLHKLIEASATMQQALINIADFKGNQGEYAASVVAKIEEI